MLRSMYSGVSGMKAHQAKMDVIGNNIANVNTYGFKSSRATFTDVYYQTTKSASGPTTAKGGVNAGQIGYGVTVGGVDIMQTRSGFQMTDNGMDVAIAGEGFFQVQDADGNIFYTRSGLFRIDPNGNLVDNNGNYVLGVSGDPFGKPASADKITFNVPSTMPTVSEVTEMINGVAINIRATNPTRDGNVSFNFTADPSMPIGQKVRATITTNGIQVAFNSNERIGTVNELNQLINSAILEANGGKEHPAGTFSITFDPSNKFPTDGITGADLVSASYAPKLGTVTLPSQMSELGFKFVSAGNKFGEGIDTDGDNTSYSLTRNYGDTYTLSIQVGYKTYTGTLTDDAALTGQIKLVDNTANEHDYIILQHPGTNSLKEYANSKSIIIPATALDPGSEVFTTTPTGNSKKSEQSLALGLGSKSIVLRDGTEGGAQTVADLTNIGIGPDGTISAIHAQLGLISVGRIDLATFENPQGMTQEGNTYFAESPNSGKAKLVNAGTSGSGTLQAGALEMSNVDLSKEFADLITTQRGFQASSRLITVSDEILNELVNLKR